MKTVVLCNGVFDPFHYGHLVYLREARKLGDILVVSVTEDEYVDKGEGRPLFKIGPRIEMIMSLAMVDSVFPCKSAREAIAKIKPQIYVKGKEYEGRLPEQKQVEAYGGRVVFTDGPVYSSTRLLTGGYLQVPSSRSRGLNL